MKSSENWSRFSLMRSSSRRMSAQKVVFNGSKQFARIGWAISKSLAVSHFLNRLNTWADALVGAAVVAVKTNSDVAVAAAVKLLRVDDRLH